MFETTYNMVERALVRTYRVPTKALGAFRGRLTNLQKQELFGRKHMPGRGVALSYGPDQVHRMIFACELFEFGVSPAEVLDLVKAAWDRRLRKIFADAERAAERDPGPDDVIMHMGGASLMTGEWSDAVPNVNSCPLRKLSEYVVMWMTMAPDDPSGLPPRALIVNLSARLRTFHAAFADAHLEDLRKAGRQARR